MQGREIKGDYIIITDDLVGRGSYGQVFKCYKKNNQNELYCMKILKKTSNARDSATKNIVDAELKILSMLKNTPSENLVKLVDYVKNDEELCLVMELCDCDLSQLFLNFKKSNQWFKREEQFQMIRQILKGAQLLKENNIVHRDIKPQNILVKIYNLNQEEQMKILKIADFGFSKTLINIYQQQDMTRAGTTCFMAPEIYNKEQSSAKCDIYSLAILFHQIVFEMRFPGNYQGRDQVPQFYEQIKQTPYKCQQLPDQDGQLLAALIEKMMLFDQNKRISFEDLLEYDIILLKDPLFRTMSQIKKLRINDEDQNQSIFQGIYTILDNLYRKSLLCKNIADQVKNANSKNNAHLMKMQFTITQIGYEEIKIGFAMIHRISSDLIPKLLQLCDVQHFISLLNLYIEQSSSKEEELHQKIKREFYSQHKKLIEDSNVIKQNMFQLQESQIIPQGIDDDLFSLDSLSKKYELKSLCIYLQNLIDIYEQDQPLNEKDNELLKKIKVITTIESRFDFFEYKLYKSDQILKL
ncbi:unnamed protein product (macronuclear) [Paramecium tetraurelia]|uniref:Protein kinase domain-containing protein n=1 Tax=Paramecium tetraurelia TaxID=5888 RepID=A0BQI3_PARTE|nr:uncharacterized protein GSPATT00031029001 [Paramecium tetraurelia]CAK60800.1 unnamed protein product [Paramecium tetraurelia]|eukprot:XP_001428198.1 hypothetical protein (macronuclear) [Paramecium tetraurelia strain d4-2]